MFTVYAGPICEGNGCYGLAALALIWLLLPIIVGLIVFVVIPMTVLRLLSRRREHPLTKSTAAKLYIAAVSVQLLIGFLVWQYPNTRFAQKQNLMNTIYTIQKDSVLLPENEERSYTKVQILSPKDYARYQAVSFYGDAQTGYIISQNGSAQSFNKTNHECAEIPKRQLEYCKFEVRGTTYYYVFSVGLIAEVRFSAAYDTVEQQQVVGQMRPYQMQSLEKVDYYE